MSPRKTQSCLFFRDVDHDSLFPTPPSSPTKSKRSCRFGGLQLQPSDELDLLPQFAALPPDEDDIALGVSQYCGEDGEKEREGEEDGHDFVLSSSPSKLPLVDADPDSPRMSKCLPNRSLRRSSVEDPSSFDVVGDEDSVSFDKPPKLHEPPPPPTVSPEIDLNRGAMPTPNKESLTSLQTPLCQLPLRHASSPLRPSQWAARGGLLCPPRHSPHTPDRFISSRRPPNPTRESFELNKPAERSIVENSLEGMSNARVDPFGARLRRSVRLNDELRHLRETHTVLTGRANLNRRRTNPSLRRGSLTLWNREVSAGAVWNVGGSSIVNDTVVGVPNGRGGLLGSGTNAPLYTSMFLSRPDPEAALEVYEQRLALALDIDQIDRILDHSTPTSPLTATPNSTPSPTRGSAHVWRDSAWIKDGVATCLLCPHYSTATILTTRLARKRGGSKSRKAVPVLPFR